jgi:hypothetical protein
MIQFVALLIGLTAMILAEGTLPHTHVAGETPGLYNEDHDLGYLATLGNASGLVAGGAALEPRVAPLERAATRDPGVRELLVPRGFDSRAPPLPA